MPRPRRWKAIRITSFYIPIEAEEIVKKAEELAKRDSTTLSELIIKALAEYIEKHYPGNPQIPLPTYTGQLPPAKTLEARIIARQLKKDLELLQVIYNKRDNTLYRYQVESRVVKLLEKLAKLNEILENREYRKLIEEGMKLLNQIV